MDLISFLSWWFSDSFSGLVVPLSLFSSGSLTILARITRENERKNNLKIIQNKNNQEQKGKEKIGKKLKRRRTERSKKGDQTGPQEKSSIAASIAKRLFRDFFLLHHFHLLSLTRTLHRKTILQGETIPIPIVRSILHLTLASECEIQLPFPA